MALPEISGNTALTGGALDRAPRRRWLIALVGVAIIVAIALGLWLWLRPAASPGAQGKGGFDPNAKPLPVVAAPVTQGSSTSTCTRSAP